MHYCFINSGKSIVQTPKLAALILYHGSKGDREYQATEQTGYNSLSIAQVPVILVLPVNTRPRKLFAVYVPLEEWFSKSGSLTSNSSITWELVRKANS